MACSKHQSYSYCPDCGAEFNTPNGFVLVAEADLKDILHDRALAELHGAKQAS